MNPEQLARTRRHATVARLAQPAQHEINNLLTVIFANLDLLRRTAAEGAPRRQLDRIGQATRRFEASTRALLALARRPVPDADAFAPAAAIAAIQPLLALLLPVPGALTVRLPAEAKARVVADRALFEDTLLACAAALSGDQKLTIDVEEGAAVTVLRFGFGGPVPAAAHAALAALSVTPADAELLTRLAHAPPAATVGA